MSLPQGYKSHIGERGLNFSGGQRQRISIARAILKGGKILILDEPTSSVDIANETDIQSGLKSIAEKHTSLTIAHRLSTIREADLIYVLKDGKIVEFGKHEDLMKTQSYYYRLYKVQEYSQGDNNEKL